MFVDEKPVLTLYDRELLTEYVFENPVQKGEKISILMENMGRLDLPLAGSILSSDNAGGR